MVAGTCVVESESFEGLDCSSVAYRAAGESILLISPADDCCLNERED
jgi:hypothetical protein